MLKGQRSRDSVSVLKKLGRSVPKEVTNDTI